MAGLSDMLENYRNWRGRSEWEQGKAIQDIYGGDVRGQEQFEKFGGFGTDAGGLVGMIKASHGSPHAFTKFLMSKIGTGEGAQAYGHGLYFGEGFDSPVAKEYRDALSGVEVGGKVLKPDWDDPNYYPLQALRKHGDDIEKARQDVYERNARIPGGWPEELEAFESLAKQGITRNQGHLYNVELRWPDAAREAADPLSEEHFLHWDKPLSEQPESLQKKIGMGVLFGPEMTGQQAYEQIARENLLKHGEGSNHAKAASDFFRESLGIPGIRYLDQGSRGAGQGTHNYVIFDEDIPNIVSRNGVSLSDLLRR